MNPVASLVERLRRSWLFDFSRESSIVVALPAEAVIGIIATEISQTGASWNRANSILDTPPYIGRTWDNGFTFVEVTFRMFPSLVVDGRLESIRDGIRIVAHNRVRPLPLVVAQLTLLCLAVLPLLCILTFNWSLPTGAVAPDYSLVPYGFLGFTIGCLVCAVLLYKHWHEEVVKKAVNAEQWLRLLFSQNTQPLRNAQSEAPFSSNP